MFGFMLGLASGGEAVGKMVAVGLTVRVIEFGEFCSEPHEVVDKVKIKESKAKILVTYCECLAVARLIVIAVPFS